MQNVGFAAVAPAFLAFHLWTSPTVDGIRVDDLKINTSQLNALPISVVIGYIIPSIAMSLPAPSLITLSRKQTFAALWQAFPLWISIAHVVISTLLAAIAPMAAIPTRTEDTARCMRTLRHVFAFGIACSAIGHIAPWSISLLALLCPSLFARGVAELLTPSNVFLNVSPFSGAKASTLADGTKWFLQWDLLVGSTAMLIWAFTLSVKVERAQTSLLTHVWHFASLLLVSIIAGPTGAAVMAIWERDELVFGRASREGRGRVSPEQKARQR